MSNILKWSLVLVALVIFDSCNNPPSAIGTGANATGRVILAQAIYTQTPLPYSGVTVTLEGTNYSTVTDDSGYYSFQAIPAGSYNVLFSKPGYGSVRLFSMKDSLSETGSTHWGTQTMFKIATIVTTLQSVSIGEDLDIQEEAIFLKGAFIPDTSIFWRDYSIAMFWSHTPDVSSTPGHYSGFFTLENDLIMGAFFNDALGTFSGVIPADWWLNSHLNSGDSIYFAVYGAPCYNSYYPYNGLYYDYFDPTIKQGVLTSINQTPSPVFGTTIP
jgi:hypothetical protein